MTGPERISEIKRQLRYARVQLKLAREMALDLHAHRNQLMLAAEEAIAEAQRLLG